MDRGEVDSSDNSVLTWRQRAIERSLTTARAKAVSRGDRFLQAGVDLLAENGDFTVQELVERSQTSLRTFYQHFASKDELLLALFEDLMSRSADICRAQAEAFPDPFEAVRSVFDFIYGGLNDPAGGGLSRALTVYHLHLAESGSADFARVLAPVHTLFQDLIDRGVQTGVFRDDIAPENLARIVMQVIVAAAHLHALDSSVTGTVLDGNSLWRFCENALTPMPAREAS
jgi:AcrR family transcriptional regulator